MKKETTLTKEIAIDETMVQKVIVVFTDINQSLRTEVYRFIVDQANISGCSFAAIIRGYMLIEVKKLNDSKAYKAFNTFVSRSYKKVVGKYIPLSADERKAAKIAADKAAGKILSSAPPAAPPEVDADPAAPPEVDADPAAPPEVDADPAAPIGIGEYVRLGIKNFSIEDLKVVIDYLVEHVKKTEKKIKS